MVAMNNPHIRMVREMKLVSILTFESLICGKEDECII